MGARVKVKADGDDYDGKIGTVQTHLDNDGDGLTIGVIFNGDKNRYVFSPGELTVVTDQATLEAHWRQLGGTLRGTWPHEFGRHRGI